VSVSQLGQQKRLGSEGNEAGYGYFAGDVA
jgi:hypothetical protein